MSETADLTTAIRHYAKRLHALGGTKHHVASPLGAWLLVALCADLTTGDERNQLGEILGMDVAEGASRARMLLADVPPLVAAAAAIWAIEKVKSPEWSAFLATLPRVMTRSVGIPPASELDAWAKRVSLGLIEHFPVEVDANTFVVLATALATKVRWKQPFALADASALGARSEWATAVSRVLRTSRHDGMIVATEAAGDVAVHSVKSSHQLTVTSVIARRDVAPALVLDAAYDVAIRLARRSLATRSLFDLPLGEHELWTISEREEEFLGPPRREVFSSVMPAWEAESLFRLTGGDLGFDEAATAVARAGRFPLLGVVAKQSAVAKFSRVGFEAAAITAMALTGSGAGFGRNTSVRRHAELRFGHPYAVVALMDRLAGVTYEAWSHLPVFSAWVTTPSEAVNEPLMEDETEESQDEEQSRATLEFLRTRERGRRKGE